MIKLYIAPVRETDESRISEIDKKRAERARRYKFEKDRLGCIAAGLLINKFLGGAEITFGSHGKPFSDNGMFFNLSHSGNYVLLALSDRTVGCDIELPRSIDEDKLAAYAFCGAELELFAEAADKRETFFRLWTRKESFLKCTGDGLARSCKSIDVSNDICRDGEKSYRLSTLEFDGHIISVCSPLLHETPGAPELVIP